MYIDSMTKYRPQTLSEFVYPNEETKELVEAYASGEMKSSLILHGASGCGKSLLQELIPNAIENQMLICNEFYVQTFKLQKMFTNSMEKQKV